MITTTSEYALRALVQLAQLEGEELLGGKELSTRLQIPANYLSKVLLALRNAGLVDATRGYGGGYRLRKPPQSIALVDVVELFEGVYTRPRCFMGEDHVCSDANPCGAHDFFRGVRASYIRFLEKTTVAAIAKRDSEIREQVPSTTQPST